MSSDVVALLSASWRQFFFPEDRGPSFLNEHSTKAEALHTRSKAEIPPAPRKGQAWGNRESCLQGHSQPLGTQQPSKRSVLAQQQTQWYRKIRIAINVLAIEVCQTKELLNLSEVGRLRPVRNCPSLPRVNFNAILTYNVTKIRQLSLAPVYIQTF